MMKRQPDQRIGTYIVRINDDVSAPGVAYRVPIDEAAEEINALIHRENTFGHIMKISSLKGTITLSCNDAFSYKIMALPFVARVYKEKPPSLKNGSFDL